MIGLAKAAPDLTTFYGAFSPVCFTLLGLWLVVVQTRHSEWRQSAVHRGRAYVLSINFALPGMMGLLSLVEPGSSSLWRVSFAVVGVGEILILGWMALLGPLAGRQSTLGLAANWLAVVLYGVITLIALAPGVVGDLGFSLTPLELEAILLSVLVFLAVNVAWLLMFDEVKLEDGRR